MRVKSYPFLQKRSASARRLGVALRCRWHSVAYTAPGSLDTRLHYAALCSEGDFTRDHLADKHLLLILRRLTHFEAQLPAPPFHRLGRSVLMNLDRLRKLECRDRNLSCVVLNGLGQPLPLGRVVTARLRAALAGDLHRARTLHNNIEQ